MKIVGVGCGPGMLTEEAIAAVREATLVYGSARAIALVRDVIPPGCEVREIADYRGLRSLPAHAVVLSTGDPMLAGLGYLPGEVVPGISSLQVAFARLKIPLTRAAVVSAHGKDHAPAVAAAREEVLRGRVVFLIADPAFDVGELAAALPPEARLAVCENLGYPEERIAVGTAAMPPAPRNDLFVVVAGAFQDQA
ncbi:cobalt-precorrin-7 (C(5))-methyltransferase [Methanoculleus sp. Wushi-C6]|uniref:Cobalt-precorrin-7 (C(5))-methyltransferase n=1 Tax=Methanoculleus caldifontis TaxID=2651577 RepID=A0ABU3X112_9EURY|nr:cobalt-precorrin-7 (C(5))-methyltransferase [Methanoculleus sp. Wushi-C6]MDV2481490.1 cobalt-precorrin-7 (C(5))-methyltransferase [Methanoculleus sp. Wushi-C6]